MTSRPTIQPLRQKAIQQTVDFMGDKNPFSIYDFLGYLFPGIVAIFVVFIVRQSVVSPYYDLFDCLHVGNIMKMIREEINLNWLEASVAVMVVSYIAGHIVAYLSSLTVEFLANKSLRYPSEYLLEKNDRSFYREFFHKADRLYKKVYRWVILFVLWPISLFLFILSEYGLRDFLVHPLPDYIVKAIKTKTFNLYNKLGLERRSVNDNFDFHRVVMHYTYLHVENAQRKADNYVALYGFLRAMCFISIIFYDIIVVYALSTFRFMFYDDATVYVNWFAIVVILCGFFICILLFLAFVKFYRRFTLENFMALITTDKDFA